jgi:lipoate-protein ligase A
MRTRTIINFEDLMSELENMKNLGEKAFIGLCCQPFFAKHLDEFERAKVPGILIDINDTTCYDLDQAKEAYNGEFRNQTSLDLDLLKSVLNAVDNGRADNLHQAQ